jgi:hypothetical protein
MRKMTRLSALSVLISGAFLVSTGATGQPTTADDKEKAAGEKGRDWTCNASPGNFNRNGVQIDSSATVAGTVQFRQQRRDAKWASTASINFRRTRGEPESAGINVHLANAGDKFLTVRATGFGMTSKKIGTIPLRDAARFQIRLEKDGTLHVNIGRISKDIKGNPFDANVAQISCSSGIFDFTSVDGPIIEY